ncbi:MAG TPA: ribonuclease HI [Clostridia bacterium]|jgi:ribonuclease HI|nr:ribonuclease HI [Clostridia bacterium]
MNKRVDIYTDGACSGNPGNGGWCAILIYQQHEKILYGNVPETTNNRMELLAAIKGIEALKEPCFVNLYSDSAYLVNAFQEGWITNWKNNDWKTKTRQPVKNKDLWERLVYAIQPHIVTFNKVKGHSDNQYNNKCDEMARRESLTKSNNR